MRQRDMGQKPISKTDLSRQSPVLVPALSREEIGETTRRPVRIVEPKVASRRERSARHALLDQLAGRKSLRQAILLSEILGPPKAR